MVKQCMRCERIITDDGKIFCSTCRAKLRSFKHFVKWFFSNNELDDIKEDVVIAS